MSSARSRCRIFPAQRDMLQLLMMWMLIFVLVFLVHETQFWMCLHPNNNPQQRLFKENGFKLHNHDSHNHAELLMFCSIWLHFWLLCVMIYMTLSRGYRASAGANDCNAIKANWWDEQEQNSVRWWDLLANLPACDQIGGHSLINPQ